MRSEAKKDELLTAFQLTDNPCGLLSHLQAAYLHQHPKARHSCHVLAHCNCFSTPVLKRCLHANPGQAEKAFFWGCDHSGWQTTTGNPVTAKMHEPSPGPLGLNGHPPVAVYHPPCRLPAKAHRQDGDMGFDSPPVSLVGLVDALGAGYRVSSKRLFVGINLGTLKAEKRLI